MGRGRKPVNDAPAVLEIKNNPDLLEQFEKRIETALHWLGEKRGAELAFQDNCGSIADQFGLSKGYVSNYAKGKYKNNIREELEKKELIAELALHGDMTGRVVSESEVEIDDDFNDSSEALAVAEEATNVAEQATPETEAAPAPEKKKRGRKPKVKAEEVVEPVPEVVVEDATEAFEIEVAPEDEEDQPF